MRMLFFAVFDSAAKRFLEPFAAETAEVAIRVFSQACKSEGHQFARYPADYTLFEVGAFEAESGMLMPLETPHNLGLAISFTTVGEVVAQDSLALEG